MKKRVLNIQFLSIIIILIAAILAGCAAKTEPWGDPEKGLILRYKMPEDQSLDYQLSMEMIQKFDIPGNPTEAKIDSNAKFSVKPKGLEEENHLLEITINSIYMNIAAQQRNVTPDMSDVIGKSFNMTLSPLGKESGFSGAEEIQYEITPIIKRDVLEYFQALFPNLPEEPAKIGSTWPTKDTISVKTENEEVSIGFESMNKLDGFETIRDMECARIAATVTGTFNAKSNAQGLEITSEGKVEGTETWYFAYEKGIFVKIISNVTINGSINTPDPNNPSIPMMREQKLEIELKN